MRILNILLISLSIFIFQCKQKNASENVLIEKNETSIKSDILDRGDTLHYNIFENFTKVNDTLYKASNIEIVDIKGILYIQLDSGAYDKIDFDGLDYDGPGYSFSLFNSLKVQSHKLIMIEAQSDIGTAWHYFIFIENNKVTDSFIIKEPRSNSELYPMEQFIKVCKINNKYVLMFKKELVAKYSKVPSSLLQRNGYYVIEKSMSKKNTIQNTTVNINNHILIHMFYSNGGILAFYTDGTVAGCPQCDLDRNNIELLKLKESFATYTADDKTVWIQYNNGDKSEMKFYVEGEISDDWAMKDGKWLK